MSIITFPRILKGTLIGPYVGHLNRLPPVQSVDEKYIGGGGNGGEDGGDGSGSGDWGDRGSGGGERQTDDDLQDEDQNNDPVDDTSWEIFTADGCQVLLQIL